MPNLIVQQQWICYSTIDNLLFDLTELIKKMVYATEQTNEELFEAYVDKQFYGMYDIAPLAVFQPAGDRLSGVMKTAYDQLKDQIQEVAKNGGDTNNFQVEMTGSGEIRSLSTLDKYRDKIKEIKIENGITVIGNNVFSGMNNLFYVNIPNTVTKLGHNCFANCPKLMRIFIPSSVQDILEDANVRPADAPFYGNKNMTIYCEINSLKDRPLQYMQPPRTGWSSYWNRYGEYADNAIDVV